jgi:Predicted hydrolases or acyltransferases (alpha/beta hydrolase superfamily)
VGIAAGVAAGIVYAHYRRDIQQAQERLDHGSQIQPTPCGSIEYAVRGEGYPVLVVHGAGGGYDQGLYLAESYIGEGFRCIAPSRFGYLRTPLPKDASILAQVKAHACLLDSLQIPRCAVMGTSGGAPSSLQFALDYPERVSALVLLVPGLYAPESSVGRVSGAPEVPEYVYNVLMSTDLPFWLLMKVRPSSLATTILGTPEEILDAMTPEERREVDRFLQTVLPIHARKDGILNDGRVILSQGRFALEECRVPTLVISAKDDLYNTYPAAAYTAHHIPQARFLGFERGGHILSGHEPEVHAAVTEFLRSHGR